jgi:hypothetical protein
MAAQGLKADIGQAHEQGHLVPGGDMAVQRTNFRYHPDGGAELAEAVGLTTTL